MEFNILALVVAAASTLVVGAIWYNPKVFGTAWMKAAEMTEEKMKGANMAKIFGLALLFAFFIAATLRALVVHQSGVFSLIEGDVDGALPSYAAFMNDYGTSFRTFKHGVLHGFITGVTMALPIIGTNALFERKSAKYIFINSGFWIVCMMIMGGIICAWE
ncbi:MULTISPECIES: DUF1761 domain-containing protein [Mangrovimonas]|uniref:DUF1761 domain-containing protein n=1 Tax=Mangrovimonas TaxID=1211036 RepID=UPI0006B40B6C|nr:MULTISPECIES: DUF1761 domain-containing protein [Mangrovimonas]OMP32239.1 hypothetical protein BKM32_04085 [Mangrovimonas sp. DI 80]